VLVLCAECDTSSVSYNLTSFSYVNSANAVQTLYVFCMFVWEELGLLKRSDVADVCEDFLYIELIEHKIF
jgi:hypothetical protein